MVFIGPLRESDFHRGDRFRDSGGCGGDRAGKHLPAAAGATERHDTFDLIADATAEAVRPVAFSVLVIIVALIPLFTMQGVPGKVFAPMSETYGFALMGAFLVRDFVRAGSGVLDASGKSARSTHASGELARASVMPARCAGRWRTSKTVLAIAGSCARSHACCWRAVPGRRIHAQARGRESLGARDAAAGRFLRDRREDGARDSRNSAGLSGGDAGGFADGPARRRHRRDHLQQYRIHGVAEKSQPVARRLDQRQAHRPDERAARKISRASISTSRRTFRTTSKRRCPA